MSRKIASRNIASSRPSRRLVRPAAEALELRLVLSTFVVNTFVGQTDPQGSATISLRDAIAAADATRGPNTIDVPAGNYPLTQGQLYIDDPGGKVAINATGGTAVINGQSLNDVLDVAVNTSVSVNGLTITGGEAGSNYLGGGIANSGTLAIQDCTLSGNTAASGGGGIYNSGELSVADSTISGNANGTGGTGGGIDNSGRMTLVDSTVSGNTGVGIYDSGRMIVRDCTVSGNGGGIRNTGHITVLDSTISGNDYDSYAGDGIANYATLTLDNSTVSDNTGGGIENGATAGLNAGTRSIARVADCTVYGNDAVSDATGGGGIFIAKGQSLTLANSIVAGNTASAGEGDIIGAVRSRGNNLIGNTTGSSGWTSSDRKGTNSHPLDADLSPLGNFGGPTQTQVPLAGSPAIRAGSAALIPAGTRTDQRGFARLVGRRVDIGAVEVHASRIAATAPAAQSGVAGVAASIDLGSFADPANAGPFQVGVIWGDGSPASSYTIGAAGSLGSQTHEFITSGSHQVTVAVGDASGGVSSASFTVFAYLAPLQNFIVNTTADQTDAAGSKTVSLRDAIADAGASVGPVTIAFDPEVFATAQTIHLQSNLELEGDTFAPITLDGPAADVTLTGAGLQIDASITADMSQFIIGGVSQDAINNSGQLTVSGCLITQSGGVVNSGTLALENSTVSDSDSSGIDNSGQATVMDCTISGNTALPTPGVFSGLPEPTTIGAGIENNQGQMTVVDSTITGNVAIHKNSGPGGIYNRSGAMGIFDCTVTGNSSDFGAGGINNSGTLTIANTIVAGNAEPAGGGDGDIAGAVRSVGHNLIGDDAGSSGWVRTDRRGSATRPLDANLSPLGSYGGPTQTQIPLPGSFAIGAGSIKSIPKGVTTDQRGYAGILGRRVDIGAVQLQHVSTVTVMPAPAQSVTAGTPASIELGSFTDPGGSGPFTVIVNWGDGSAESTYPVGAAGSLGAEPHVFLRLGALNATVADLDGSGDVSNFATLSIASSAAAAQTITVNTIADSTDPPGSGTVSLLDAVDRADAGFGPVAINFDPTVFGSAATITLASNLELQNNPAGISIDGPSAGLTIAGSGIVVDAGVSADISRLDFANNKMTGYLPAALDNSGQLAITGCTITGSYFGIENSGQMSVQDCTVNGNVQAVQTAGQLDIVDSTITGNGEPQPFYGDYPIGGIQNDGRTTIADSTITGNTGFGDLENINDTKGTVTLSNSIVSLVSGPVDSLGNNLIGDASASSGWVKTDLTGTAADPLSPKLAPLGNNGGPTQTEVPLSGSPAIGAGSVALIPAGVTTDQRGLPRVVDGKVDIGAVEVQ